MRILHLVHHLLVDIGNHYFLAGGGIRDHLLSSLDGLFFRLVVIATRCC